MGYDHNSPPPTRENPLGVEFPGDTWAEPDQPNWVGHLITNYSVNPALLVRDYAVGGDTVAGVKRQIQRYVSRHVGVKPEWRPWKAENTLFGKSA